MTRAGRQTRLGREMSGWKQNELQGQSGPLFLGIDIGSVSCKLAMLDQARTIRYLRYERTHGRAMETARGMLKDLFEQISPDRVSAIVGTGSAGRSLCELLEIDFVNELICQAAAIHHLHPQVNTLIEMGGQDSKILFLNNPEDSGDRKDSQAGMVDFTMNTNCAAGTGSFLDQQASRLGVSIEEEFGKLALRSERPPRVAGRCSVFAKSDMIHLQQQATPVHDIVAGLCLGLARNLKSSLCQGKQIINPVAFCGGVASNAGVVRALEDVFDLSGGELIVPAEHALTGAIGAVLVQMNQGAGSGSRQEPRVMLAKLEEYIRDRHTVGHRLKPLAQPSQPAPASPVHKDLLNQTNGQKIPAYLGVDVGSISTNVVVMDTQQRVLSKAYLMTASRPLEAVRKGLEIVWEEVKDQVDIRGVATTGSGRYLTGDFVGADLVINEITAQATGAALVDPTVDTIFEIGGQDSKYISLEEGVVVDFEMNHACAAGTGSFLEEQAERLDLNIKEEFAREALKSESPIRLGERCTVFMESDLLSYQQQGAARSDLVAGLAYSIVTNYLNRVVGHRKVGQRIFFQGGTAFNRSVVSAFEAVTGKAITVPDHHEVTGALGAAELARRHMRRQGNPASSFRGFDLSKLDYQIRTFECKHCANNCESKEVILPGSDPLFYGSRCDRYNVKKRTGRGSDLPDLFVQRQKLLETYARIGSDGQSKKNRPCRGTVGLPLCLSNYQFLPLWGTFLNELGFDVISSGRSSRGTIQEGVSAVLSETCFPVKVAHGHVLELIKKGVDYIWLPSIVSMSAEYPENRHNQLCPYVQTIPYQVRAACKAKGIDLSGAKNHLLDLPVRFQDGLKQLRKCLRPLAKTWDLSRGQIHQALDAALGAQEEFECACRQKGREILENLPEGKKACVLVSRPYNGCDPGVNLDLPGKLRKMDILAIPMDFLDLAGVAVREPELQREMYWKYGQRIFRAAHLIRENPKLHAVYLSNFSCGPDSFIISFFKELMVSEEAQGREVRKPTLVLEIDEHSADAGVVTRLEAFHESLKSVEKRHEQTAPETSAQPCHAACGCSPWRKQWTSIHGRTLYVPWMGDHAHAVAAAFRHCGQDSRVLPMGDEETLRWGRKFTSGKECLPCIITTGDMLKKVHEKGFDPKQAAFFMPGSSGPCRFGQYSCLHRLILKQSGLTDQVAVISPNQDSTFYDTFKQFRKNPVRLAFMGIAAIDLLHKTLLHIRPYEQQPGCADQAYQEALSQVIQAVEKGYSLKELTGVMESAGQRMAAVPFRADEARPVVVVVGEIYVRSHTFANDHVVRRLEKLGAEVHLAAFSEWLYYTNLVRKQMAQRWGDVQLYLQNHLKDYVQRKIESRLAQPLERRFGSLAEGKIQTLLEKSAPYIHHSFEGEAILSIGKMCEMYEHGACGVVNVGPFTCMPSTIVAAMTRQLSRDCHGLPILNVSYDGQQDPNLLTRLEAFMHQVGECSRQRRLCPEKTVSLQG